MNTKKKLKLFIKKKTSFLLDKNLFAGIKKNFSSFTYLSEKRNRQTDYTLINAK